MKNSIFLILLFLSSTLNLSSDWVHSSSGMYDLNVYSLAANNTKIFAGTPNALSVSTNNGVSWYLTNFNAQLEPVHSLSVNGNNIYAGVQGYGLTVSSNNGGYWTIHHPVGNRTIYSVTHNNGFVYAGASVMNPGSGAAGVHVSIDNGYNFTLTSLINKIVFSLTSNGNTVFAGTQNEGIYITNNNGVNWSQTSLNNQTIKSLASNGSFIFAGTGGNGVYISSNNGSSWVQSSLNNLEILALAVNGSSVFAGSTSSSNFYVSTNNGAVWTLKNEGLGSFTVNAICITNGFIFAGTSINGVYKRLLSDIVGIQPISNEIPAQYSLSQNYPNPFNPVTKIRFQIPLLRGVSEGRGVSTKLLIYDILGREVAALVNEQLNPGTYEVNWDASNYPSGVYYYSLIAGDYKETRKLVLVK